MPDPLTGSLTASLTASPTTGLDSALWAGDDRFAFRARRHRFWKVPAMILELARLTIRPGGCAAFEAAFATAAPLIAIARGYRSHQLQRCIEHDHEYVLLVHWDCLEDHIEGFRESSAYAQWRTLLHHFYMPHPTVEHFARVA